ncbi:MAG: hypothetical protein FWF82_03230, partial [Oscillospiraceae bacterium]|nr:hypothetical protein [Oscillospiraceae bacterium]
MKKKILSILLALTMALSLFATVPAASADETSDPAELENELNYRCGDVLGNGKLTISSALEILKYLAKIETDFDNNERAMKAATAFSRNDTPTINDALEILKYLAKLPNYFSDTNCYCDWCFFEEVDPNVTETTPEITENSPEAT